jgi:hypothetical protein
MFEDSFQGSPSFLLFTAQGDRSRLGETSGLSHTARKAKEVQGQQTNSFRPNSALYNNHSHHAESNEVTSSSNNAVGGGAVGGAGEKVVGTIKKEYDKICRSFTYSIRTKNASLTIPSNEKKACKCIRNTDYIFV